MEKHTCPVWVGYLLASPIRKLYQHPKKILGDLVRPGMTVLDVGCAMGFFSIPVARMVGPDGRVICMDLQHKMLNVLQKRARRRRLLDRLECRTCSGSSLQLADLENQVDAALAFAVVHEVDSPQTMFTELFHVLKPGGRLLVTEPRGHVTGDMFVRTLSLAEEAGFRIVDRPEISKSHGAMLIRS